MEKKEIIEKFRASTPGERKKMTAAALKYMAKEGHQVSRQAAQYWRTNEMTRSKIDAVYLEAYHQAMQQNQNQ